MSMMTDPADAKAELPQDGLGLFDHPQLALRHLAEVRNPRRQAGGSGLVPGRQPGAVRQLANLGLRQTDGVEG